MTPEKKFELKVKEFLTSKNIYYFKIWGGGFQRAGLPDIVACINGRFVGIEIKSDTGRPSELQKYNLNAITKSKGLAVLLYPKDFAEFKKFVENLL